MKRSLFFLIFLFVSFLIFPHEDAKGETDYAGVETCKNCHEASYESYSKSIHGKKVVPNNPANDKACETCHGPGAAHVEKGGGRGAGEFIIFSKKESAEEKSAVCLNCHETSKKLALWDMGQHKKMMLTAHPVIVCTQAKQKNSLRYVSDAIKILKLI